MDSITQAVLGAAMGEATTGKKLKNKALVWGAIAGTIPDLDVFSRLFVSHPVDGLLYHRGLTHSILFTLLAPLLFAWLAQAYYARNVHQNTAVRAVIGTASAGGYALILGLFLFLNWQFPSTWWLWPITALIGYGGWKLARHLRQEWTMRHNLVVDNPSYREWVSLFFWAILTHWLIDACTAYGTQIFEPFSDYRIAFNNIFIFDPLYTLPLIIGCWGAAKASTNLGRQRWNWLGIGLSTTYMAWSFYAKHLVNQNVIANLKAQGIAYEDFITYPSVGNTILWQTTIKSPDAYYYSTYSLLDQDPSMSFVKLPKNHELLQPYENERYVKILKWFAQDYYNVLALDNGQLQVNNLRFGLLGDGSKEPQKAYVFKFLVGLFDGKFDARQFRDIETSEMRKDLQAFWQRLKGSKPQAQ